LNIYQELACEIYICYLCSHGGMLLHGMLES